jgi:hypothetical protein
VAERGIGRPVDRRPAALVEPAGALAKTHEMVARLDALGDADLRRPAARRARRPVQRALSASAQNTRPSASWNATRPVARSTVTASACVAQPNLAGLLDQLVRGRRKFLVGPRHGPTARGRKSAGRRDAHAHQPRAEHAHTQPGAAAFESDVGAAAGMALNGAEVRARRKSAVVSVKAHLVGKGKS